MGNTGRATLKDMGTQQEQWRHETSLRRGGGRNARSATTSDASPAKVGRPDASSGSGERAVPNLVRERRLATLAARQHGVVAAAQLLAIGFSRSAVDRRVRAGRLHPLHHGVLAVGHADVSWDGRLLGATLAAGVGSAISHVSAAELHGLRRTCSGAIHVISPREPPTRGGIVGHRTRELPPEDIVLVRRIPVTSVARTLVQLASSVDERALSRAWRRAVEMRTLDTLQLVRQLRPGRAGSAAIRRLLAAAADGDLDGLTRSELELLFVDLVTAAELGLPLLNVTLDLGGERYEVDALWPAARLVVEIDGWSVHSGREAFETDRRRDAELVRAGYRVVRFTWRRIVGDPSGVAATLRELLET